MEPSTTRPLSREILSRVFGYSSFRGDQEQIVEHVVAGGDALVLVPTGGGKSLCYQIPALMREGVAVVVSPLIALMQDQVDALRQNGVKASYLNSTLKTSEAKQVIRDVANEQCDLLYVSPERLLSESFQSLIKNVKVALFAVDEAHCVSMWGHDFRPEYVKLDCLKQSFPDVPLMALTATADEPTRKDIVERLRLGEAKQFVSSFDRPNINYRIVPKVDGGRQQLLKFIEDEHPEDAGIVYCQTRNNVEKVAEWLRKRGVPALPYHAGMSQEDRARHQERFQKDDHIVMVATVAFGMGIDKSNVRFVAHLAMPKSLEHYYQETGRAGRDGLPSNAWMAFGHGDAIMVNKWLEGSNAPEKQKMIERQKLNALLGFCETCDCRRKVLLNYFGEQYPDYCGNCDICLDPPETYDGTVEAQKALSAVYRTDQIFGAVYLVDVLVGSQNARIKNFGHDKIKTYGVGKDRPKAHWFAVYRQLIAAGYLGVDHERGGLFLRPESAAILKGEVEVMLRRDPVPEKVKKSKSKKGSNDAISKKKLDASNFDNNIDKVLFDALKQLRRVIASENDVPAYIIFSDATLVDMVFLKPQSLDEMLEVRGVGEAKLEKYGDDFLEVILGSS